MVQEKLTVTISETATGQHDYMQIVSKDQFGLNIVLIAEEIEIVDARAGGADGEPEKCQP